MKENANCTNVTIKHTETLGFACITNQSDLRQEKIMIDLMVLIFLIFSLFGVMSFAELVYDAHQRGMERVRKYDLRQESKR